MDDQAISAKSDLERILLDERMEAKALPLSLLKCITNNFSDEYQIGRGGFGVVYKGHLGYREVAVKKLTQDCTDEKKFTGEVHCLMKAKHKNIVRFIGYCSDTQGQMVDYNGQFVMAEVRQRLLCFEYVPKGTLDEYIKGASHEWGECYKIIKEICEGLHYLHKERIVHRDLKPVNILLANDMVPKITDFGMSRCFDDKQTHHITSKLIGTLGYMAPELHCAKGKITFKSDIYSLGMIIIEILTGDRVYPQVEEVQEHWSHKLAGSQKVLQLEQIQVCTKVAQSCLEFNPKDRPESMQEIIDTLKQTEREEQSSHISRIRRYQEWGKSLLDAKTIDRTMKMLMQTISKIYARDTTGLKFEDLYRGAYQLVLHKKGEELYSAVKTTIASEVQSLCRPLDDAAAPVDSTLFLQELLTKWDLHIWALRPIRDVFAYMDHTFVPIRRKMPTYELGFRLWRDEMARSSKIRQSLIEVVKRQKGGKDELVPGINKMLSELGADVKDMPCLCFQDDTGLYVAGP